MPYAEGTTVAVEKSRYEIEKLVRKRGGDQFVSGWSLGQGIAQVGFTFEGRQCRFKIRLPTGKSEAGFEREHRRLWRCLLLVIKAKFEIVDSKIQTFEEAFLGDIVMPDGQTMSEWSVPQIERMYEGGDMPPLLDPRGRHYEPEYVGRS